MKKLNCYRFFPLAAFLIALISASAMAQDAQPDTTGLKLVPADSLVAPKPDTALAPPRVLIDTVRYRFIGDGNFTRGNVNRSLMVLRAELIFSGPVINIATNPRFTYGKQNGILAERDSYLDLFVDVFKKRRTYVFGLAALETSNLRRIDLRQMAGAGIGYRVLRSKSHDLSLTDAMLYESTNFFEKATVTTIRNSFRIKGKHSFLSDKFRFNHLTFIQPALNDLSNVRWNTILSAELPLNKWVTLRTSFENSYESVVETGRKRNDSRITFGISIGNK
ncbi:hypothetical protein GCM10010967_20350 [Dyadobacter beijingensis]|uniref:DUF481 domain-containing protein n=1 Tax=Dyadobacter beijingensis TaxID=365489 RepID=A0ABQ2HTH4_9BACT|nr:DUF481 domain-containing protein [Dyadobacter beijingensis]GGM87708.1 hypothetical protein GCM10010967_20350 [Dyadobacter beijingensis]